MIDGAMELAIVPSFSRIGPALRRRLYSWTEPAAGMLAGRTALVTGPTSGLGRKTATKLAQLGARVVLAGRDQTRLSQVRDELAAWTGEDRYPTVVVDMSSLRSVRRAVEQIRATELRLDVLVDNAGAIYPQRTETAEGIERTLAVLVVGPYALTSGLLPLLSATPGARVISVTSGGMYTQAAHLDDLAWRMRPFSGPRAYAQGKRIQVALVREWARRFAQSGIAFNAMHPGWADTPGLAESLPGFSRVMRPLLRTAAEGTDTIVWLATDPTVRPPGGCLYLDRRARPFDRMPQTRLSAADRQDLWDEISELAGLNPAIPTRL